MRNDQRRAALGLLLVGLLVLGYGIDANQYLAYVGGLLTFFVGASALP